MVEAETITNLVTNVKIKQQQKYMVYPHVILNFMIPDLVTDGGPLQDQTNEDAILDIFTGEWEDTLLDDFNLNDWQFITDSVADQISDLIQTFTTLDNDQSGFYNYLMLLTKEQLYALVKRPAKSRFTDKDRVHDLLAVGHLLLMPGSHVLSTVVSAVEAWHGQTYSTAEGSIDGILDYNVRKQDTWRAKLIQDHFGVISGTDLELIEKIIQEIVHRRLFLPTEMFKLVSMWIGQMEMPGLYVDDVKNKIQTIDVFCLDNNQVSSHVVTPKLTGTLLTAVKLLKGISKFYDNLAQISKFLAYHDDDSWGDFLAAYKVEALTFEFLTSWPKLTCPWFLYYFGTHYDDAQSRLELITNAYDSDYFISKNYLTRDQSDGSDARYLFIFRTIPNFTDDQILTAIFWGYYMRTTYFSTSLTAPDYDLSESVELGVDDRDVLSVFKAIEVHDSDGELSDYYGLATPTLSAGESGWTNKTPYTPFIIPQDDSNSVFRSPFKFETALKPTVSEPTTINSLIGGTNDSSFITTTDGLSILDNLYPRKYLEAIEINKDFWIPYIFETYNPVVIKNDDKDVVEPAPQSTLTADTYSKSEDKNELNLYIKDLDAKIAAYRKAKKGEQQIANLEKTIERVRKHMNDIKDNTGDNNPPAAEGKGPNGGDE